jgi:O-acetyl-ADP-ribose deacetylase (regulator of RNase III)
MSIQTIEGNLLDQPGILVHGCNCHGVMGAGIALAFRRKWPDVFTAYQNVHRTRGLKLGEVVVVASAHDQFEPWAQAIAAQVELWSPQLPKGTVVVNLMSQKDFGSNPNTVYVSYDAIEAGFRDGVAALAKATGFGVSFPLIGCGLANGKWEEVSARIESALADDIVKTLVVVSLVKAWCRS